MTTTSKFPSLTEWLQNTTKYIRNPELIRDEDMFTFVIGNESCDLDSFVSSIVYAYCCECVKYDAALLEGAGEKTIVPAFLKTIHGLQQGTEWFNTNFEEQFKPNHHFVPLISVPSDQFEIRALPNRLAILMGIKDDLVTLPDLAQSAFFEKINFLPLTEENRDWGTVGRGARVPSNTRATVVLVDHNTPTAAHRELMARYKSPLQTIAVIDHHIDAQDTAHNFVFGCSMMAQNPRIIEVCGSTTSLIVNLVESVISTAQSPTTTTLQDILPTTLSPSILPLLSASPTLVHPIIDPTAQNQRDRLALGDLLLAANIIDTVGLDHSKGKRTPTDDTALAFLTPASPSPLLNPADADGDAIRSPSEFATQVFAALRGLLEDTGSLSISQLFLLDAKTVESKPVLLPNTTLSVLFAAIPTKMELLLANHRVGLKSDPESTPVSPTSAIGHNLIKALAQQHHENNYDIIVFCTYHQVPGDNTLQRELIISTSGKNGQTKGYDAQQLSSYLTQSIEKDESLGLEKFPVADHVGAVSDNIYQEVKVRAAAVPDDIAIEIYKQRNSNLSRKYLLPALSKLIAEFQ